MEAVLIVCLYIFMFVVGLSFSYLIIRTAVKNGIKAAYSDMGLYVPKQHNDIPESHEETTNSDYDDSGRKYKWYE